MSVTTPFTDWSDPPLPGKIPLPLRLVAIDGGVVIYQAETVQARSTLAGDRFRTRLSPTAPSKLPRGLPPQIEIAQVFSKVPNFDLVPLDRGGLAFAIEFFQGATHALMRGEANGGKIAINAIYHDFTNYQRPRFVRGNPGLVHMATAVVNRSSVAIMDEQPLPPGGRGRQPSPYTILAAGDSGVAIQTTPPNGKPGSVALFTKVVADGSTLSNGDRAGTLLLAKLKQGHTDGKPEVLFQHHGTYNFDVDAQGEIALVLGSTLKGPQLISCDLGTGKITEIAWPTGYPATGTWIASPTVLALPGGGRTFALAFFESSGSGATGIRYAQLDLPSIG